MSRMAVGLFCLPVSFHNGFPCDDLDISGKIRVLIGRICHVAHVARWEPYNLYQYDIAHVPGLDAYYVYRSLHNIS